MDSVAVLLTTYLCSKLTGLLCPFRRQKKRREDFSLTKNDAPPKIAPKLFGVHPRIGRKDVDI